MEAALPAREGNMEAGLPAREGNIGSLLPTRECGHIHAKRSWFVVVRR